MTKISDYSGSEHYQYYLDCSLNWLGIQLRWIHSYISISFDCICL